MIFFIYLIDYDREIEDAAGNQPISSVLDIVKGTSKGSSFFTQTIQSWLTNNQLINTAKKMKRTTDIYSAWYDRDRDCEDEVVNNEHSLIDHILVSKGNPTSRSIQQ